MKIKAKVNSRMIRKQIIVSANTKDVWERWTTHEGLLTFFGAENSIEMSIGGKFEIYFLMDAVPGLRGSEGCKVLSFVPHEMLSFSWNAPPSIPEVRNHEHKTWVVVQFESVDPDQVRITLSHLGWMEGLMWDKTFDYFEQAWNIVLDNFRKCYEF